jgi:hypothetical protein
MRAPYTAYGGLNETGNRTTANNHHLLGGSTILVAPSFNTSSGRVQTAQDIFSQQGDTLGLETRAGVYNLTFACPSSCGLGAIRVTILWNLSWAEYIRSNCSGYYSSGTWVRAIVNASESVYNVSSGTPVRMGSAQVAVFRTILSAPSYISAVNATKLVRIGMNLPLRSGYTYEIQTLVYLLTSTHSLRGCGSYATATISAPIHAFGIPTVLPKSRLVSIIVS